MTENLTKELPTKEEIVEILKKVKDPETEFSIFDLRLIKYIDYREKDKTLIINASFNSRMPHCKSCQFLSFKIIDTITKNLENEFYKYSGIENIEYIDI